MRAKVDGTYLNYELTGSGSYVTFIHGLGADGTTWQEQVLAFSDRYQVLTVDVRGFGHSDKPKGPYSVKMFVDDLYRLFKVLGIKKTVLAGHSMGGMISQTFALEHPEMLSALILVDTSPAMATEMLGIIEESAKAAETKGMAAVVDASLQRAFSAGYAQRNPEAFALHRELRLRNDPNAYAAASRAIAQFNLLGQLKRITCPTLIIVGDQDMPTPIEAARTLNQNIAGSKMKVIKDSGHNTMVEQPEAFNAAVSEFLKALKL